MITEASTAASDNTSPATAISTWSPRSGSSGSRTRAAQVAAREAAQVRPVVDPGHQEAEEERPPSPIRLSVLRRSCEWPLRRPYQASAPIRPKTDAEAPIVKPAPRQIHISAAGTAGTRP